MEEKRRYKKSYDVDKLRKLLETGKPRKEIAKILGVSRSTIDVGIRQYDLTGIEKRGRKPKYDERQLREYVEAGRTNEEIGQLMGVSKTTVQKWIKENGMNGIRQHGGNNRKPEDEPKKPKSSKRKPEEKKVHGHNANRRLCKTCKYRPPAVDKNKGFGCEYILVTGHRRGCEVEDCSVYEKGRPVRKDGKI